MKKFNILKGIPANLPMMNVDTDMIIPKQFLKTIKRTGLGKSLFFEMCYDEQGKKIDNLNETIKEMDYITIHAPLTEKTRNRVRVLYRLIAERIRQYQNLTPKV